MQTEPSAAREATQVPPADASTPANKVSAAATRPALVTISRRGPSSPPSLQLHKLTSSPRENLQARSGEANNNSALEKAEDEADAASLSAGLLTAAPAGLGQEHAEGEKLAEAVA